MGGFEPPKAGGKRPVGEDPPRGEDHAFLRALRGLTRARISWISSVDSGNRFVFSSENTTVSSTATSYTPWSPGTSRRADNVSPNSFKIASASWIALGKYRHGAQ